MKQRIAILFLFTLTTGLLFAQTEQSRRERIDSLRSIKEPLPFKIQLKYADALFETGNYYEAMDVYLKLTNERPDNHYLVFMLGESNRMAKNYKVAEKWYAKLVEVGGDGSFPLSLYQYAQMLKRNGKYDEAKYAYAKFSLRATGEYEERAKKEIEACDFSVREKENPGEFEMNHLDSTVNTPFSDYAPVLKDSVLYYSTYNPTISAGGKPLSRVHSINIKGTTQEAADTALLQMLNHVALHAGNCTFSDDGKRVYFTWCRDEGQANIKCSIYLSQLNGKQWSKPVELSESVNASKSNNTHPFVAKGDGSFDLLFFTSNRSGGIGGYDLWCAEVNENGIATPAMNLGENVNTDEDEVTPYYTGSHLYFSSSGHIGLGGFDVFVVKGRKGNWARPKNLGSPLNTGADELYFTPADQPKTYYLVSNRSGSLTERGPTCCDDIFSARDISIPKFAVSGEVYVGEEGNIRDLIMGVKMEVREVDDGAINLIHEGYLVGESEFFYELEHDKDYEIKFQKKGYFPNFIELSTKNQPVSDTFLEQVLMIPIEKKKSYKLEKLYYDFGKASLSKESKASLDLLYDLLEENPKIVIEISAHTDNVGSPESNLVLSQQRAQTCVNYLLDKGIKDKRLIAKGYGENRPIAPNALPDGSDNEAGRQLNRRTEIKVIGELSRKGDQIIYE